MEATVASDNLIDEGTIPENGDADKELEAPEGRESQEIPASGIKRAAAREGISFSLTFVFKTCILEDSHDRKKICGPAPDMTDELEELLATVGDSIGNFLKLITP